MTTVLNVIEKLNLSDMSKDQLIALVASMQSAPKRITLKVTAPKLNEKTGETTGSTGAIALYGLGRFPVTLYRTQWERLLAEADTIRAFIEANAPLLATKD